MKAPSSSLVVVMVLVRLDGIVAISNFSFITMCQAKHRSLLVKGIIKKWKHPPWKVNPRLLFHYPSVHLNISYTIRLSQNIHSFQFLESYTFKLCLMLPRVLSTFVSILSSNCTQVHHSGNIIVDNDLWPLGPDC
jgi:hypothetical protein